MLEKNKSVFTYWMFWVALVSPILVSLFLMYRISENDNLFFGSFNKVDLNRFLDHMNLPLWILGSSVPFATLAAANFRALQFQENLDYQKRNLERQEYEHALDLYHKELDIFKSKLSAFLNHNSFELITAEDTTTIYSRIYKKPIKTLPVVNSVNDEEIILLSDAIKASMILTHKLNRFNFSDINKEELEKIVQNLFSELSVESKKIVGLINTNDILLVRFVHELEPILESMSEILGVKIVSYKTSSLKEVLKMYRELINLYCIIEDSNLWPKDRELFTHDEKNDVFQLINVWVSNKRGLRLNKTYKEQVEFFKDCIGVN